jgi:hypothetical protein
VNINSDINILGGLPDWNLIPIFQNNSSAILRKDGGANDYTAIKTHKAVRRFESAIKGTLLHCDSKDISGLINDTIQNEKISPDSLIFLFWNASFNNELLEYLNGQTYFIAFYSGRISLRQDETEACLKDLKEREPALKKWAPYTLTKTASKYLTLLKKFGLMEGTLKKTILHPYLNDKMFVLFVYWLAAVETKPNLLESNWLKYSFCERQVFLERLMQKKYAKYFQLIYTGDKLTVETTLPYSSIYHAVK